MSETNQNETDHLKDALTRAKRIKSDAGEVEKTSVSEAIEYDRYQRAREAQKNRVSPFGAMGYAKISPGGTF